MATNTTKKTTKTTRKPWCPLCGQKHAPGDGTAGYSCEPNK